MHKSTRRRELLQRIITYFLMTVSVVILVAVCLFLVLGYSVDEKTGQPEQGGLIQFRTFPEGASIMVDGAKRSFNTPGKTNTNAGRHSVEFTKDNYRSWSKSFELGRGELLWLNALLIPKDITTSEVQQFEGITSIKASPDKKWIAVVEKANEPLVKIIDLRDEKNPKTTSIKIPENLTGTAPPSNGYAIAEWDFGSRYILLQRFDGQTVSWLRLDRTNAENSRNITTQLKINITDAHFIGSGGNALYVLSDQTIRKIDIGSGTISQPVASDVTSFELYKDDRISYVGRKNNEQVIGGFKEGNKQPKQLKSALAEAAAGTTYSSYFQEDYQALFTGSKVELYKNPLQENASKVTSFDVKAPVRFLYFSNSGRFLVAQTDTQLFTYDIERHLQFTINASTPEQPLVKRLKWLDDFHIWNDVGGTFTITEFDGANSEAIGQVIPGMDATLSDNGKRLFSIGENTATKKPTLQSSIMVLE